MFNGLHLNASIEENPFYQWFLVEMCTTSWRSFSFTLFALFCSLNLFIILFNSSNVYFNEFTHHLRYESAFQPNDWFASTWNHFSNIGVPAFVSLCVVTSLSTSMGCVCVCCYAMNVVQNICPSKHSIIDQKPKNVIHNIML